MEKAPIGSCFNDPTQPKCPPAERISDSMASTDSGDATLYAPASPVASAAKSAKSRRRRAFAAAVPQCAVRATEPFFAAGLAQGFGANQCYSTVTRHELYVTRYDYISSGRRALDTRTAVGTGASTIRGEPKFNCYHAVNSRKYEVLAEGYALLQGVWYAANQRKYATFTCPY